ncbi:hypothetical protein SLA2020_135430 [Shorea laevis]
MELGMSLGSSKPCARCRAACATDIHQWKSFSWLPYCPLLPSVMPTPVSPVQVSTNQIHYPFLVGPSFLLKNGDGEKQLSVME